MTKIIWVTFMFIGSALGWWLGSLVGMTTAYIVSCVGALVGTYLGVKLARQHFD